LISADRTHLIARQREIPTLNIPGLRYCPRLTPKYPTEKAQLARINRRQHLLPDADLREIAGDPDSGIAREIAHAEIERRGALSAHQRVAEATRRASSRTCAGASPWSSAR
jgi:hypothetical protein